jgi:NADH dehydrogenase
MGAASPVTWDEVQLMEAPMTSATGTADAESLGVKPLPMREVLGAR